MKNLSLLFIAVMLLGAWACKKQTACEKLDCGQHGHCVDGVCVCDSFWSGGDCQILSACVNINCGAHGHCVNGVCVCDTGWGSEHCMIELNPCPNANCGPHRHCANGTCVCDAGWSGANCDVSNCANVNCGLHQHCDNGVCQCDDGWGGANCYWPFEPIDSLPGTYHLVGTWFQWTNGGNPNSGFIDDTVLIARVDNMTLSCYAYDHSYTGSPSDSSYVFKNNLDPHPQSQSILSFPKFVYDSVNYTSYITSLGGGTSKSLHGIKIH